MTREEIIEVLKELWRYEKTGKYTDSQIREALELTIKALEQEPCEDAISRQDAIDALYKMLHDCFGADDEELDAVITTVNELPPVKPAENWAKDYKQFYITKGKYFMSLYPTKESCPNDFIKEAWDIWYDFLKNIQEAEGSK